MFKDGLKKYFTVGIVLITVILSFFFGDRRYRGEYSEFNGTYVGTDALGRVMVYDTTVKPVREDRYVGLFYFLWQGQHGTGGPYDNNKIFKKDPNSVKSEENWIKAGGGSVGEHHFWGEPLYGYYTSDDEWVLRKHVQMLTDANVDFLVFDTTNAYTYDEQALKLFSILDEYSKKGYDVPKIVYYTNTDSGGTMQKIYENIYLAHPEYKHLWFYWDDKPLIIGSPYEASFEVFEFFRIKESQWPTEGAKQDGFPWMSFSRPQTVFYTRKGVPEVINVSIAQHPGIFFSKAAFYGVTDKYSFYTRSYHNGENDLSEDAYIYGYNFAEQFKFAIKMDPKIIFITGWNEWVAQRQGPDTFFPIQFVDNADPNTSRDAEPMEGGYGDNYYLQMINFIRKYKGTAPRVNPGKNVTININGDFSQWDKVTAVYKDYTNDIVDRNALGFGDIPYVNTTGRNDFDTIKVAKDRNNIYFYVKTVDMISDSSEPGWMTLFISTGDSKQNAMGYEYILNRVKPEKNKAILERCISNDISQCKVVGKVIFNVKNNEMMVKIPRRMLGIGSQELINIQFKWADNVNFDKSGEFDVFSFYKDGDVAPIGRLNYLFAE